MITKKTVWFIVLSSSTVILGITNFICDTERPMKGSDVVCTCVTQNNVQWQLNDILLSTCTTANICSPKPAGYVFQNDVSNADKEYSLTVQDFDYSSCTAYSCTDTTTSAEEKVTLTIAAFNSTVPSTIVEPGAYKNGAVEITTECLFRQSDIVVKWYTVKGENKEEYEPSTAYSVPTACTDTCNGENAVTLKIGFEHTGKTGLYRKDVKFRLEVYHTADETNKLVLETDEKYNVDGPLIPEMIAGIVCLCLYITGIILGIIKYLLLHFKSGLCEKLCDVFGKGDKLNWWVIIPLCFIIVGLGIITVWLIWKLCCTGSAEKPGDSERNEKSDDL